jgi:hypothetical protein
VYALILPCWDAVDNIVVLLLLFSLTIALQAKSLQLTSSAKRILERSDRYQSSLKAETRRNSIHLESNKHSASK